MGKVWFVGAGPGTPDLITVRSARRLAEAGAILYTGSLVAETVLQWAGKDCEIADSKSMDLARVTDWLLARAVSCDRGTAPDRRSDPLRRPRRAGATARRRGRPGRDRLRGLLAAAASECLTLPEITQTVIFTRLSERTRMPEGESLTALAAHGCTLCIFLSIGRIATVVEHLTAAGWACTATVMVVHKATWPDAELVLRGTLEDIAGRCRDAGVERQALILVSPALGARSRAADQSSKLYDAAFPRCFRPAREVGSASDERETDAT